MQGAAGGIGVATIQLAKAPGARVIAVVSTDDKARDRPRAPVPTRSSSVSTSRTAVKELTGGRGVDLVLDPVGGDRFTDSLRCLAPEGRLLVVGFTAGAIPEVKVNRLLFNNLSIVGVALGRVLPRRPRRTCSDQWPRLLPALESGALVPLVGNTYPLEQAADGLSSSTSAARGPRSSSPSADGRRTERQNGPAPRGDRAVRRRAAGKPATTDRELDLDVAVHLHLDGVGADAT